MLTLNQLIDSLKSNGAQRILFKELAGNDNSKNQIYLGGSWSTVSIFPSGNIRVSTTSTQPQMKAPLNFYWMGDNGRIEPALGAQLILYPQYPEVRLSGFLKGCSLAPSKFLQPNPRIAGRILVFGIAQDGKIIAYLVLPETPLAHAIMSAPANRLTETIHELDIGIRPLDELLAKLLAIHQLDFIDSCKLDANGIEIPYIAENGGGYTLEAKLGIIPNGIGEPDYKGIELKQFAVSKFNPLSKKVVTLMTPEPRLGYYKDFGVIAFLQKYGRFEGAKDRYYFTGKHIYRKQNSTTHLLLETDGLDISDPNKPKIVSATGGIVLIDPREPGIFAAKWTFEQLIDLWKRKHNQTIYVPSIKRNNPTIQYKFGDTVLIGTGTSPIRLLRSIVQQFVFYDPATKAENISATPKVKKRNQFRVSSDVLANLYDSFVTRKL